MLTSCILLIGSRTIAPPLFDPVGSAAVPIACAIGLLLISLVLVLQAVFFHTPSETEAPSLPGRPATLVTLILMVLYILTMNLGLRYAFATTLFVLFTIPVVGRSLKLIPLALLVALGLGFGSEWVFTQLFFVDLPGAK